ncbi:MAG: 1,2-phenylacetyl-CoA epoxidase subunit PaaC [Actinomycetota bacterium]
MSDSRLGLLLSLADDELILGHRMSEWTGWVPYVEEDLALSSIAQDEMAHARALYELASPLAGRDVDALALGRAPQEYRHAVLCERPNRDYAYTLARHYLYDTADHVRMDALLGSSWKELADLAGIIELEERYHREHAQSWFDRLATGPVEARARLTRALSETVGEAMALFEPLPGEAELLADGTMPRSSEDLLAAWLERLGRRLEAAGLERVLEAGAEEAVGEMVPTSSGAIEAGEGAVHTLRVPGLERRDGRWAHVGEFAGAGGRVGRHSHDFASLWDEMTALYRGHPGASW